MEKELKPIPFSIELWQQGYRPMTRGGREVTGLRIKNGRLFGSVGDNYPTWYNDGSYLDDEERVYDLFLLPPEDEMIVTIEVMLMNESGMKYIHISDVGKIKPGKYKLTKIG